MTSDGYTGEFLFVDLSNGTTRRRSYPSSWKMKYIGGRGFGVRVVSGLVHPGIDPLSPENVIAFMTGLLTGSGAPMGSRFDVAAVSPLTGTLSSSNSGGHFGAALKRSGIDGIVATGKSESPVVLEIGTGRDELVSADDLWGKTVPETTRRLIDRGGEGETRVACIGPAGERLSRIASIMNDADRAAGRGGMGAVMGSKGLKAIAISGGKGHAEREPVFTAAVRATRQKIADKGLLKGGLATNGTAALMQIMSGHGLLAVDNHQHTRFGDTEAVSGEEITAKYLVGRSACHSCPVSCGRITRDGGVTSGGPEFESVWALGPECGVFSLSDIIRAARLCNELGLDTISTGVTIACAMELSERGHLPEKLRFGDAKAVVRLVKETAFRTGIGDLLAEGSYRLARHYGHPEFSMSVKRLELPAYDPRGMQGQGLAYATSVRGGCHVYGNMVYPEILGVPVKLDPFTDDGKAFWTKHVQDLAAAMDAAGLCVFSARVLSDEDMAALVAAFTGVAYSCDDFLRAGERTWNLQRLFNLRSGIRPEEDSLPARLTDEPIEKGPAAGRTWRGQSLIGKYYALRGWDREGWPTRPLLEELGIAWAVDHCPDPVCASHELDDR